MSKRFTLGVCERGLGLTDNETKEQYLEVDDTTLIRLCEVLNELSERNNELQQFKERVFLLIDKRIQTLEANSKQCHQGGSHEKGIEFTLQAELLERLKKELDKMELVDDE